jgi:2-methylcitrate dehydratase PrpD
MPFCAAVAARTGGLAWDDYATHLADPETLALTGKVRTKVTPKAEAAFPGALAGEVMIKAGGRSYAAFVPAPKGEPENFPTPAEFHQKFDSLSAPYLPTDRRDRFRDALSRLEEANQAADVFAICRAGA